MSDWYIEFGERDAAYNRRPEEPTTPPGHIWVGEVAVAGLRLGSRSLRIEFKPGAPAVLDEHGTKLWPVVLAHSPGAEDLLPRDHGAEAIAMLSLSNFFEWADGIDRVPNEDPDSGQAIIVGDARTYMVTIDLDTGLVLHAQSSDGQTPAVLMTAQWHLQPST